MSRISYFALAAIASVTPASAQVAPGWTGQLTPVGTLTENSDNVGVYSAEHTSYVPACAGSAFMIVSSTDEQRARMLSTILTAIATGRKIVLWYTGTCHAAGFVNVTAVRMY